MGDDFQLEATLSILRINGHFLLDFEPDNICEENCEGVFLELENSSLGNFSC